MKSALYTYQKNESTIDFEGRISLIFFTKGCNFRCRFCHNPELIPPNGENISYDKLESILEKAKENWVDGICISGGEPTMQKNLAETVTFIKSKGLDTKLDTQGSYPAQLKEVMPYCDYIAMDYKMPLDRYSSLAAVPVDVDAVLESMKLLKQGSVEYEIRTTVIPGIHTEEVIRTIAAELKGVDKFVLQTFIPRDNLPDKDLRVTGRTPVTMLETYADICREVLENVIVR